MDKARIARAADLIEKNGWFQGYFWEYKPSDYKPTPRCCAAGAVILCGDINNPYSWNDEVLDLVRWMIEKRYIRAKVPATPNKALTVLAVWNDALERTQEQVVAVLRKAAQ